MIQRLMLSFRNLQLFHSSATKIEANFWSEVHYKQITNPELSNAITHDVVRVLSLITLRKYGDSNDPLRPLITSHAPPPMSFA